LPLFFVWRFFWESKKTNTGARPREASNQSPVVGPSVNVHGRAVCVRTGLGRWLPVLGGRVTSESSRWRGQRSTRRLGAPLCGCACRRHNGRDCQIAPRSRRRRPGPGRGSRGRPPRGPCQECSSRTGRADLDECPLDRVQAATVTSPSMVVTLAPANSSTGCWRRAQAVVDKHGGRTARGPPRSPAWHPSGQLPRSTDSSDVVAGTERGVPLTIRSLAAVLRPVRRDRAAGFARDFPSAGHDHILRSRSWC